ncbi:MAG: spore cortex biosynthesis protein YabQ [Oscillospiraceae bacterium]|jgi:spore cortex biosynthesis protein YabQ|nr:spore cortex biosynthesis protein YabQ [Oscillospiraceae bacterium]
MRIEVDIALQNNLFLQALLLGAGIGVLYDFFRLLRIILPAKIVLVFIQDVIFWVITAVATFLFMLVQNGGVIRGYLLIAELAGALIYYFTLGALFIGVSRWIAEKIRKTCSFIFIKLIKPLVNIVKTPVVYLVKSTRKLINDNKLAKKSKKKSKQITKSA